MELVRDVFKIVTVRHGVGDGHGGGLKVLRLMTPACVSGRETGEVKGAQGAFDEIKGLAEKNYKRLVELTNVAMLKYRMTESRR